MVTLDEILNVLQKNNNRGMKAREIASKLGAERREVNSVLYQFKNNYFVVNDDYEWFIKQSNSRRHEYTNKAKNTNNKQYSSPSNGKSEHVVNTRSETKMIYLVGVGHYSKNIDLLIDAEERRYYIYNALECILIFDFNDRYYPDLIKVVGLKDDNQYVVGIVPENLTSLCRKYVGKPGSIINIRKSDGRYDITLILQYTDKTTTTMFSSTKYNGDLQIDKRGKADQKNKEGKDNIGELSESKTGQILQEFNAEEGVPVEVKQEVSTREIQAKDFVVRRNTFHCLHMEHDHEEIVALVNVMAKSGNIYPRKVSAAYCPECNMYFIMESSYIKLRRIGVLMCRLSDDKAYIRNKGFFDTNGLATESLLKQYGYNVAQDSTLTAQQRCKILELIIDNGVCSKDAVISYLDYFINMHKNRKNNSFAEAISKWESDRDYIENYNVGKGKTVKVESISCKR